MTQTTARPPLVLVPLGESQLETVRHFPPVRTRFNMRFPQRDKKSAVAAFFLQQYIAQHGSEKASALVRELLYRAATGQLGAAEIGKAEEGSILALDAGLDALRNFWEET